MAEYGSDSGKELTRQELTTLFNDLAALLNKSAIKRGRPFSVLLVGGAVMLMKYNARPTTGDSDGDFIDSDAAFIRKCINKVASKHKLKTGWLNRKFKQSASFTPAIYDNCSLTWQLPGLDIYTVNPDLLLCMKLIAYREKKDIGDVDFIIKLLRNGGYLLNKTVIFSWLQRYYKEYGRSFWLSKRALVLIDRL